MDRSTGFRWGKGLRPKVGKANLEVVQPFHGPDPENNIKYVWSDAPEISFAISELGIRGNHDISIFGDSQGNGIAGNNNRDITWARLHC
jgi:hypothetical protein